MGAGELLYLGRDDVAALDLGMLDVLDAVETSFREKGNGRVSLPPKVGVDAGAGAFAHAMPAAVPAAGALGMKWVCAFPANPQRGLPTIHAQIALSDPVSGRPLALIDGGLITALRTGASAGVAARLLAAAESATAGILGCGVQARTSVRALAAVLPALTTVRCYDVDAMAIEAFVNDMEETVKGLHLVVCDAAGEVPSGAGVVVTAIPMGLADAPPLGAGLLEPGALAVALDYDAAWSPAAMAECERVFCDDVAQARATAAQGDHLAEAPLERAGDLGEIVAGRRRPSRGRGAADRTLCLNLGIATHDVVVARLAVDRARERGVGRMLPL
jgi:ornithine cyclodeaminase/alanine dehydrogenase-like protein (mu-crystallin family)